MTLALSTLTVGVVVVFTLPAVFAQVTPPCTKVGDAGRNVMSGTPQRDVLCARAGNDFLSAGQGNDVLRGEAGRDTIVAGHGNDRLLGGSGRDRLFAIDGAAGDVVDGGRGRDDLCHADPGDRFRGCERTFRGPSLTGTNALSAAFAGQGNLAEELIGTPTATPQPQPRITITVTITPGECIPGPPQPEPFCEGVET